MVFDGDSLTTSYPEATPDTYPEQTIALMNYRYFLGANLGVGGQTVVQMLADAETEVDALYSSNWSKNIAVVWGGINDLNAAATAADTYTNLTAYIEGRQAAGFKVIVLTCIKSGALTDDEETQRQAYNALIMANSGGADAVVDVASAAELQDPENMTYFFTDNVHLVAAGYAVVAGLVAPAIDGL